MPEKIKNMFHRDIKHPDNCVLLSYKLNLLLLLYAQKKKKLNDIKIMKALLDDKKIRRFIN